MSQTSRQLSLAAQALSVGRGDLVDRVEKMDQLRKETSSRERDLRAELSKLIGDTLSNGEQVVYTKRTDKSTHDFEFLGGIAASINGPKVSVLVSAPTGSTPSLIMVNSPDNDTAKNLNEKIKSVLNAIPNKDGENKGPRYKGGGAKGRYMGKLEGKWGKEEDEAVEALVREVKSGFQV